LQDGAAYFRGLLPQGAKTALISVQGSTPELSDYLIQRISEILAADGYFTVVERDQAALDALALGENYQFSGEVGDETALAVGKLLGAEYFISGSISRAGAVYRLDLKAVAVETAQVAGLWFGENIASDPAWADLGRVSRNAGLAFAGAALSDRDKQVLLTSMVQTLKNYEITLELTEVPADPPPENGYLFTITFSGDPATSSSPGTALVRGEFLIALTLRGRVLGQAGPYAVTETNRTRLIRQGATAIWNDKVFFQGIKDVINR
jgi:hypothetical protein